MLRTAPAASSASQTPANARKSPEKQPRIAFRELVALGVVPKREPDAGPIRRGAVTASEPTAAEPPSPRVDEREPRQQAGDEREGGEGQPERFDGGDWSDAIVDPMFRALAQARPCVPTALEPAAAPPNAALLPELERMLARLVKRAAWGGDGKKGTARLELGAGELEGATLLVQAEAGELSIDLELPPGAATEEWRERLLRRLSARGLVVREITVR